MKRILILVIALIPATGPAFAADLLTFNEAVRIALQRNPAIAVARNNAEIAGNNTGAGNAGLLPRVDLAGSSTYTGTDPQTGPDTGITRTSAQIAASYTIFDGMANLLRYRRLASESRLGELEARRQIESILVTVSQAYYGAAASQENLRIARSLLEISRERLARAKNRAGFGQGGTVDVLAAQVDFNTDTVTVVKAEFAWQQAKRDLNVLLDRDISADFEVEGDVVFSSLESYDRMLDAAVDQNAAYRSSVESTEYSRLGQKITRSAYLPTLSISTSYGYDSTSDGFDPSLSDPSRSWDVMAVLNFNLFDGFRRRTASKNAAIELRSRQLEEKQARLELGRELADSHESYRISRLILDLEEQNFEAAQLNFDRTSDLYDLGQVTSTQFREAQLNLIQAEINVSGAKYGAKLDEIDLLRIMGRLVTLVDSGEID